MWLLLLLTTSASALTIGQLRTPEFYVEWVKMRSWTNSTDNRTMQSIAMEIHMKAPLYSLEVQSSPDGGWHFQPLLSDDFSVTKKWVGQIPNYNVKIEFCPATKKGKHVDWEVTFVLTSFSTLSARFGRFSTNADPFDMTIHHPKQTTVVKKPSKFVNFSQRKPAKLEWQLLSPSRSLDLDIYYVIDPEHIADAPLIFSLSHPNGYDTYPITNLEKVKLDVSVKKDEATYDNIINNEAQEVKFKIYEYTIKASTQQAGSMIVQVNDDRSLSEITFLVDVSEGDEITWFKDQPLNVFFSVPHTEFGKNTGPFKFNLNEDNILLCEAWGDPYAVELYHYSEYGFPKELKFDMKISYELYGLTTLAYRIPAANLTEAQGTYRCEARRYAHRDEASIDITL